MGRYAKAERQQGVDSMLEAGLHFDLVLEAILIGRSFVVKFDDRIIEPKANLRFEVMYVDVGNVGPQLRHLQSVSSQQSIRFYASSTVIVPSYQESSIVRLIREPDLVSRQEPVGVM